MAIKHVSAEKENEIYALKLKLWENVNQQKRRQSQIYAILPLILEFRHQDELVV